MKKRIIISAVLFASLALPQIAMSQSSAIMYGSTRNPVTNSYNPAFFPRNSRLYLSLPNAGVEFAGPLSYSDIFRYDPETQKTFINAGNILDSLSQGQSLRLGSDIHAVGLGINFGHFFITASTRVRLDVGVGLPRGLTDFLKYGNWDLTGPENAIELLGGNMVSGRLYGEGAVGLGINLGPRLTVGARAKVLMGYLDFSDNGSSLKLTTAEDYSSLTADLDFNFHTASCVDIQYDSATRKFSNPKILTYTPNNRGFCFDFGFRYATGLFEIAGSLLDIGKGIHWQENIKSVVSPSGSNSVTFSGVDVSSFIQGGSVDTNIVNDLKDSLMSMVGFEFVDGGEDYWTTIPTKINLSGIINITKGLSAGIYFHGELEKGILKIGDEFKEEDFNLNSRTSVLARISIADWVEIIAATAVIKGYDGWSFFNPGGGLSLTPLRVLQVYAYLDYISDFYVVDAKKLNVSVGVNLFFGRDAKRKKSNGYSVLDY